MKRGIILAILALAVWWVGYGIGGLTRYGPFANCGEAQAWADRVGIVGYCSVV